MEYRNAARSREHIGYFSRPVGRVDGHNGQTREARAQLQENPLSTVGRPNRNVLARFGDHEKCARNPRGR
ncbi:hypothetical protein FZI94_28010 [Mycobacterium sp. CBMA226]|nr:hypothetical protein [Mycolicibacterium sp. CBMA 226]